MKHKMDEVSKTVVVTHQASTKWTIENFDLCMKDLGESMLSPAFSSEGQAEPQWYIMLYPSGRDDDCKDFLSAYICCRHGPHPVIKVKGIIGIIGPSKDRTISYIIPLTLLQSTNRPSGVGRNQFIKHEHLFSRPELYLTQGHLTIFCHLTFALGDIVSGCDEEPTMNTGVQVPASVMSDQMGNALRSADFTDVTFLVQGKQIRAHKVVLSARCPVFQAMLRSDMRECRNNEVVIDDMDHVTFKALLKHIYTDLPPSHDKYITSSLLVAAHKYQLPRLQAMCEDILAGEVTVNNVLEAYELAEKYGAKQLQRAVEKFMRDNIEEVAASDDWRYHLADTHPALALVFDTLTSDCVSASKKRRLHL